MLWALAILTALAVVVLVLRFRVSVVLTPSERFLRLLLGRTGLEIDFLAKQASLRLFGIRLVRLPMTGKPKSSLAPVRAAPTAPDPRKKKAPRVRRWQDILDALPQTITAIVSYLMGLLRGTRVEEFDAALDLGFEEPDMTGLVCGAFAALAGTFPGSVARVRFTPHFDRPMVRGEVRFSVALPVYLFVARSIRFVFALPKRKLYRAVRGYKGVAYV